MEEHLMAGYAAYTTIEDLTTDNLGEQAEASPGTVVSAIMSFMASAETCHIGC